MDIDTLDRLRLAAILTGKLNHIKGLHNRVFKILDQCPPPRDGLIHNVSRNFTLIEIELKTQIKSLQRGFKRKVVVTSLSEQ